MINHTGFFCAEQKTKMLSSESQLRKSLHGDTTLPPRTVVVTSEFTPALKQTSKINFNAATPLPDSVSPKLEYDIPVQNLSFSYRSPALKAMAENIDSTPHWSNTNFLKLGYGNYTTPYPQAGLSFGNGVNSVINVNGKYHFIKRFIAISGLQQISPGWNRYFFYTR